MHLHKAAALENWQGTSYFLKSQDAATSQVVNYVKGSAPQWPNNNMQVAHRTSCHVADPQPAQALLPLSGVSDSCCERCCGKSPPSLAAVLSHCHLGAQSTGAIAKVNSVQQVVDLHVTRNGGDKDGQLVTESQAMDSE